MRRGYSFLLSQGASRPNIPLGIDVAGGLGNNTIVEIVFQEVFTIQHHRLYEALQLHGRHTAVGNAVLFCEFLDGMPELIALVQQFSVFAAGISAGTVFHHLFAQFIRIDYHTHTTKDGRIDRPTGGVTYIVRENADCILVPPCHGTVHQVDDGTGMVIFVQADENAGIPNTARLR